MRPILLMAVAGAALVGLSACGDGRGEPAVAGNVLGPEPVTVRLDVHHSRFLPEELTVEAGTTVRFVIDNGDPIDHEFIVGDDEVHTRHEAGTEARHDTLPGEVSIDAGTTAETTYIFDDAGTVVFACHLPKHLDYGMTGKVTVVAMASRAVASREF